MARKKKARQRHCGLTSEGWVYVVIVCFISIGGVLRNVNLLTLATGLLLAPLIFNWRVSVANLRSLSAKRGIPEHVHAQTPVNVTWTCDNVGGRLAARNVIIHDRLNQQPHAPRSEKVIGRMIQFIARKFNSLFPDGTDNNDFAHVCFQTVTKLDPVISTFQCFFPGRGKYELGPAELKTSFPFGLVACKIPLDDRDMVYVAPPLGKLNPTWERRINSMETGSQSRMRRRGLEKDEFYAMRKWRSGDSRKDIHWRSTARFGFPMVKQFDQPNDRDFALLLDLHDDDAMTRLQCETILSFAATALSQATAEVQGQLAVAVCGEENNLVAGRQNQRTRGNVMRCLAVAKPALNPDLDTSVVELASQISIGTPLFCLSTRAEPDWLKPGDSVEINPALSAVKSSVRWIRVDSDEFSELFSADSESRPESISKIDVTPAVAQRVERVS